jgi:VIT1/CCC1 family predicted Fe2+/Mn2+ transporter
MAKQHSRERWLHDVDARQRNVVFPDTVENEARFWRNLGKQGWTATIAIGLFVLGVFVFGSLAMILMAVFSHDASAGLVLALAMVVVWGSIFGVTAWATRRTLRRIEDGRRSKGHKF